MTKAAPRIKRREIKWYGARPDTNDARDRTFDLQVSDLPREVDLRDDKTAPVMNQGNLGSCVFHATTAVARYVLMHSGQPDVMLSRLQLYYDTRVVEGTIREDAGAEIRDAIKCLAKTGAAHEKLWPYIVGKFARKPGVTVYRDATNFEALEYKRVPIDGRSIKTALAQQHPVIVGLSLYDSFESEAVERTGVVPMPDLHREQMIGGHCMYLLGYGQRPGTYTCRNSWAMDWGDHGDCYLPEAMVESPDYGADYWIISKVGKASK